MAEDEDSGSFSVKLELNIDDEEYDVCNIINAPEDIVLNEKEDTTLKPIVYTTKLDDMNTFNRDIKYLKAKDILERIDAESKPKIRTESIKHSSNSNNLKSFIKVVTTINDINLKAVPQLFPIPNVPQNLELDSDANNEANTKHKRNTENIAKINKVPSLGNKNQCVSVKPEISDYIISSNSDLFLNKELRPCYVILEDIKNMIPTNQTIKLDSHDRIINKVKEEEIKNMNIAFHVNINVSPATEISPTTEPKQVQRLGTNHKTAKNTSFGKPKRKRKTRICYETSSDEDYEPVININKKPKTKLMTNSVAKTIPNNVSSSKAAVSTTLINDLSQAVQERCSLIILVHKKKYSFVYRVNTTKLVTDFFVTKYSDEFKFAQMYPKDEKCIEEYCCWYKREEKINLLCTRKNYPHTIQKFLKQPHTCPPEKCHCCCHTIYARSNQSELERTRAVRNRSRLVADSSIQQLLNKTKLTTHGLVSKALTYSPKELTKNRVKTFAEKYLDNYILCLKSSSSSSFDTTITTNELYEIGQNGNVLRSLILQDEEEVAQIRKTYQQMLMPIKDVEVCCWYKREKIIHELKTLKTAPAALKYIQKPHRCHHQKCSCCCKPPSVSLRVKNVLSIFKQTTAHEKDQCELTVQLSAMSKNAILKSKENYDKGKKNTKSTDGSKTAPILSECASKNDSQDLSISILSKFKNLKLGINNGGQLEAVLNGPAKNLSVAELKVLSEILAHSTEQIVELGISAEEFCNKINTKAEHVISATVPEHPLVNSKELELPLLQNKEVQQDTNVKGCASTTLSNQTKIINETVKYTIPKLPSHTKHIEPARKIFSLKFNSLKSTSSIFSSLSHLMETKSENYVNSFKSFFNKTEPYHFVSSNTKKFTPVSKLVGVTNDITTETPQSLPIISETFSLVDRSTIEPTIAVPGPSGISSEMSITQVKIAGSNSSVHDSNQTETPKITANKSYKRKIEDLINSQIENKIRVKPLSQLNAEQAPPVNDNSQSKDDSVWPVPIIIKREEQTNIQQSIRPKAPLHPIVQSQTYVAANNVNLTPNSKNVRPPVAVTKVYKMTPVVNNHIQITTTASNVHGVRYLTLAPLNVSNNVDTSQTTMLANILNLPQAQLAASNSGRCLVPPLVPIRPATATVVPVSETSANTNDLEESIIYTVIQNNN